LDVAEDTARGLLSVDPSNIAARNFLDGRANAGERLNPAVNRGFGQQGAKGSKIESRPPPRANPLPKTPGERTAMERELSEGYEALRTHARELLQESRLVQDLKQRERMATESDDHIQNIKALIDGRLSAVVSQQPPPSARALAR